MKKIIYLIIVLLNLASCDMKLKNNFYELTATTPKGLSSDKYGFAIHSEVNHIYIGNSTLIIYFKSGLVEEYNIKEKKSSGSSVNIHIESQSEKKIGLIHIDEDSKFIFCSTDSQNESGLLHNIDSSYIINSKPIDNKGSISFQEIKSYENSGSINGHVKKIITKTYSEETKFGDSILEPSNESFFEYDIYGNIIHSKAYVYINGNKELDYKIEFKYENKNIIFKKKNEFDRWKKNKINKTTTTDYTYNKYNKIILEIETWKTSTLSSSKKTEYIYENDTILLEKNIYQENDNLEYKLKYKKDNSDNIIETKYYSTGEQKYSTIYNRDGFIVDGYLDEINKTYYTSEFYKIKVAYSKNTTVETHIRNKGISIGAKYNEINTYNTSIYNRGREILKERIEYNYKHKFEDDKYVVVHKTYKYLFDKNNNWIKRKIDSKVKDPNYIINISPVVIEERAIEYY